MDKQAKDSIIEKVNAMKIDIGYPEWIRNETELQKYYGQLDLDETQFLANRLKVQKNSMSKKLKSLKSTAEPSWKISPTTVNANFDRTRNTISKLMLIFLKT